MAKPLPLPPERLIRRVGWYIFDEKPLDVYERRGREQWNYIKSMLPDGWWLEGRRVLDFGCGAGRVLRHAAAEKPSCELWGCDIDTPSVDWMRSALSPPLHVFGNDEQPPLDVPDAHFDLVWAFSVFTHLVDSWSEWLVELHRVLKPDGLLMVTIIGPGHSSYGDEPISEEIIGMNPLFVGASWDSGGPLVLHSEWWLRAHWGRAFEIVRLEEGNQDGRAPLYGQSLLLMRKRPGYVPTVADLERTEPGEPRELAALHQGNMQMRREAIRLARELDVLAASKSWRWTAPLRATGRRLRALRGESKPPG